MVFGVLYVRRMRSARVVCWRVYARCVRMYVYAHAYARCARMYVYEHAFARCMSMRMHGVCA